MPIRLASIRSGIGENMEDRYLFKAKHIHVLPNNNRLDGSWVVGFLSGERYIANDSGEYLIDPSTICQCTGLKDKNGKLIWEKDVVRCEVGTAEVIWDKSGWRTKWLKTTYGEKICIIGRSKIVKEQRLSATYLTIRNCWRCRHD